MRTFLKQGFIGNQGVDRDADFLPQEEIFLGLSGGADSLALLGALAVEYPNVHALIVDHQLQKGSGEVAEKTAALARSIGVKATIIPVTVAPGNLEAQARIARYQAFGKYTDKILLAHTRDDAAETLLMHLLRGHMQGLHPRSVVEGVTVFRPLLGIGREETAGVCRELGWEPWQDPANFDPRFTRVRIRHEVLPLLADIAGPAATKNLAHAGNNIVEAQGLIHDQAVLFLRRYATKASSVSGIGIFTEEERSVEGQTPAPTSNCALPISALELLEPPIRLEVIALWLESEGVRLNGAVLRQVEALVSSWHGQGAVRVGKTGRVVGRIEGTLAIREEKDKGE
ncbi:MAG: tRNA lysidine(34) synthetase TilS [Corynebacterium sp.]|nr:tRNA lysidine(34) synthetase TilS [Corynebacterium sp.]